MTLALAEPLMQATEVAELLHVDPWTVRRWAQQGDLSAFRLPGGGYRFRREDVEKMLTEASKN